MVRSRLLAGLVALAAAGCATAPSAPEAPKKPDPAPAMAAKAPEPAKPVMAAPPVSAPAPLSKTPIVVDLTKVKWAQEGDLFGWDDGDSRLHYYANGTAEFVVKVPADGEYQIVVAAASQPALNEHAKFTLTAVGKAVGAETTCTSEDSKEYAFTATLAAGERKLAVTFTNDIYKENEYDRNFYLHGLKLVRTK